MNYPDGMRFGGKEPGNPYADEQPEEMKHCEDCAELKYTEEIIRGSFDHPADYCLQCFAENIAGYCINLRAALIGAEMDDDGLVTLKIRTR